MVGGFLGEDLSKVRVLQQEGDFGFHLFCGNGEFSCHCEFGNEQGVQEESFAVISKDSLDLVIVEGVLEILVLHVMVEVVIELRVIDGVYVYMSVGTGKRFSEKGIMPLGICGMGGVEVF